MPEVAHAGHDHGDAGGVGGGDHLVVAHGTARLDDGRGAGGNQGLKAIGEGEEGVRGDDRANGQRAFDPRSFRRVNGFAMGDAGGVDALLGEGALQDILLYHVTNGRRTSKSVVAAPAYKMLNGDKLSRGELVEAGLGQLNISASNGVIHEIDAVLLPF